MELIKRLVRIILTAIEIIFMIMAGLMLMVPVIYLWVVFSVGEQISRFAKWAKYDRSWIK